ncbi:hypothetical protein H8R18_00620 [Nanchangia anserum]|uniref:Uncharacterized protein n=1 Tax=Nanchangia anserum TaxID=2692125 RepID=A0A8I0GGT8_9ACTO|nr:hypothetical protein [Nanchangia anserum]MBD3689749.1 hypothetical protein [Nanchangia anserum]QOX81918.1 hypothetical protein H8R18_00620 [Nanchangia anserum]
MPFAPAWVATWDHYTFDIYDLGTADFDRHLVWIDIPNWDKDTPRSTSGRVHQYAHLTLTKNAHSVIDKSLAEWLPVAVGACWREDTKASLGNKYKGQTA